MPRRVKVTNTVFARGVEDLAETINAIYADNKIAPADLVRGLLLEACQFKRRHGWFSFPVVILPEKFHLNQQPTGLPPANLKPGSVAKWLVGMAGQDDYYTAPYGATTKTISDAAAGAAGGETPPPAAGPKGKGGSEYPTRRGTGGGKRGKPK